MAVWLAGSVPAARAADPGDPNSGAVPADPVRAPVPAGPVPAPVPAAPDPTDPARQTPPVVVEGIRPAELPEDPSSFTTVIEMDAYEGEAVTVEEILGDTVGVQVRRFGGPGDPAEISIRGSTAEQVVILLDGIRLNSAQSGAVDLSTIPRELLERIEVSRGGGSAQTGSDAIGGVVNLVTRRASGVPRTTAAFSGESWDTWTASATQTGMLGGFEVVAGYAGFQTDGDWEFRPADRIVDGVRFDAPGGTFDRVNNDSEQHATLARVARDLGEWGRVSAGDSFLYDTSGRPGPDAGAGPFLGQSLTAHQRRTRNVADVKLELAEVAELGGVSGELRVFHRYDRSRFRDPMPAFRTEVDSDNRNHSLGTRAIARRPFAWAFTEHAVSLESEFRRDWLAAKGAKDRNRNTFGVFLQDDAALWERRVRLIPALRFDDTQGFDGEWIPRFGVVVAPWPWLHLKGNVERSYRAPNFDELYFDENFVRGNPDLKPEDALNADVGFDLSFARLGPVADFWLQFALFRNDIDESIVFQPISLTVIQATNTGAALVEGVELAGGFRLLDWVGFSGDWTLMDPRLKGSGTKLPGRADEEYHLRLVIGPPSGLIKLTAEWSHRSSIPVTTLGATRVGPATTYDASLVVDAAQLPLIGERIPGERLLLSVTARNLTDVSVRDAQFFPQPGRWLAFRVEWTL